MGKCTLQYQCGHSATVWIFGKAEVRKSYLEWTCQNEACPACRREAIAAAPRESLTAAVATAK